MRKKNGQGGVLLDHRTALGGIEHDIGGAQLVPVIGKTADCNLVWRHEAMADCLRSKIKSLFVRYERTPNIQSSNLVASATLD